MTALDDRPTEVGRLQAGTFGYPAPVSDEYDHEQWRWCLTQDEPPASHTHQSWGHCRSFCQVVDSPQTDGLSVAEHGPLCRSMSLGGVHGRTATNERFSFYANLVEEYRHGTYRNAETFGRRPSETEVQFALVGDGVTPTEYEAALVNISVGDARRLAACLLRLADLADNLTVDMLTAKADRKAGR